MSSFPLLTEPLTDGTVVLRDYEERDIPEILIAYQDDSRMHLLTAGGPPAERGRAGRAGRARGRRTRDRGARHADGRSSRGSDTCRGQIRVEPVDWDQSRAELRIWLAPQVRGTAGSDAGRCGSPANGCIGPCGLARVELLAEPDNAPMISAAQAAGFVREGVLREYLRRRGKGVDVVIMSLIPDDV